MAKKVTFCLFLLTVFSLPFANFPSLFFAGMKIQATELLFAATALGFTGLVAASPGFLRKGKFYFLLAAYAAAQGLSAAFSVDPRASALKLAGIGYLVGLAVAAYNLVRTEDALRIAVLVWIAAAVVASAYSVFVFAGFYIDRSAPLVAFGLSHYGTFPVGDYPRIQSLFANPNMFCHYLGISWVLLLLARDRKWIGATAAWVLGAALLFAAAATLSPCIGGIALATGIWIYFWDKGRGKTICAAALYTSVAVAVLFVAATAVKVGPDFRPAEGRSARVLAWGSAASTFAADPLTGRGVGTRAADVRYGPQHLTDAHNMYLNVLAESGIPAAAALIALGVWLLVRLAKPLSDPGRKAAAHALGTAFFVAFFYQGITGSFEDARHLWVLAGLAAAVTAGDYGSESDG